VDFDALDGQPVTLMFGLVVPEEHTQNHLEILAQLAERFRDEAFCAALRDADSRESLYRMLCGTGLAVSSV
jgi:PTS system nitrogen regulatory IIA component